MDGGERRGGHHGVPAALLPDGRYSGEDGSGRVRVELDGAAREVAIVLADGWRSAVPLAGLAAAVLQAFSAATTARLTAWAAAPAAGGASLPTSGDRGQPASRPTVESLSRAWRDLHEFRLRLTSLHAATETVSSPGRRAVVTVAGGRPVGLELDPEWLRSATSQELERHIGHALRAALTQIAALPERALEGCPDLRALLAGSPFPLLRSPHSA